MTFLILNWYFQDTEVLEQIDRDVMRTHPDMHFFSGDSAVAKSNQVGFWVCLFKALGWNMCILIVSPVILYMSCIFRMLWRTCWLSLQSWILASDMYKGWMRYWHLSSTSLKMTQIKEMQWVALANVPFLFFSLFYLYSHFSTSNGCLLDRTPPRPPYLLNAGILSVAGVCWSRCIFLFCWIDEWVSR